MVPRSGRRSTAQLWITGIAGDRSLSRQNGGFKSRHSALLVAPISDAFPILFAWPRCLPRVHKHRRHPAQGMPGKAPQGRANGFAPSRYTSDWPATSFQAVRCTKIMRKKLFDNFSASCA
jgi:hypothetical protein